MNKIPTVNLSDFLSADKNKKQKFIDEIGHAYENIGFVALKGHFLDDKLVDNLYEEVKNFFDLPLETKKSYEIPGIGGQRGYVSFGKESAKGKKEGDLKEFWHFGQYVEDDDERRKEYPENVAVKELSKFNKIGKDTYQMLEKTAKYVLRALALHLNLEETYFDNYIHNGNSILRPIHYPPITEEPKNAVRAAAHGDINLITLLVGASAEGLQAQDVHGNWVPIAPPEGHLVINVGDMLQRLTNNVLRSTPHRVVNPPKEKWGTRRFSIPFFLHPRSDMDLTCLDFCVTEDNPLAYEPITGGEYLQQRLREIGLK